MDGSQGRFHGFTPASIRAIRVSVTRSYTVFFASLIAASLDSAEGSEGVSHGLPFVQGQNGGVKGAARGLDAVLNRGLDAVLNLFTVAFPEIRFGFAAGEGALRAGGGVNGVPERVERGPEGCQLIHCQVNGQLGMFWGRHSRGLSGQWPGCGPIIRAMYQC